MMLLITSYAGRFGRMADAACIGGDRRKSAPEWLVRLRVQSVSNTTLDRADAFPVTFMFQKFDNYSVSRAGDGCVCFNKKV